MIREVGRGEGGGGFLPLLLLPSLHPHFLRGSGQDQQGDHAMQHGAVADLGVVNGVGLRPAQPLVYYLPAGAGEGYPWRFHTNLLLLLLLLLLRAPEFLEDEALLQADTDPPDNRDEDDRRRTKD